MALKIAHVWLALRFHALIFDLMYAQPAFEIICSGHWDLWAHLLLKISCTQLFPEVAHAWMALNIACASPWWLAQSQGPPKHAWNWGLMCTTSRASQICTILRSVQACAISQTGQAHPWLRNSRMCIRLRSCISNLSLKLHASAGFSLRTAIEGVDKLVLNDMPPQGLGYVHHLSRMKLHASLRALLHTSLRTCLHASSRMWRSSLRMHHFWEHMQAHPWG